MKKVVMFAAAALSMLACQKESVSNDGGLQLTATIEQQVEDGTRTALASNNTVVWSKGDQITVHMTNDKVFDFDLYAGEGTTSGKFESVTATGTPDYAIYPASAYQSILGANITFKLPAVQNYAENSFGNGANVAVAAVTGSSMEFKNVCGVLCLSLKGNTVVSKIELTGKDNENLWGTFSVNAATAGTTGASYLSGGGKTLELNCGDGVGLDMTDVTNFYFVVPVVDFAKGFDATITDIGGHSKTVSTTDDSNSILRSQIRKMPTKNVTIVPDGYTLIEYILNTETWSSSHSEPKGAYVDTNFITSNNTSVRIAFMYYLGGSSDQCGGRLFGNRIANPMCGTYVGTTDGHINDVLDCRYGTATWVSNIILSDGRKHEVLLQKNELYVDGNMVYQFAHQVFSVSPLTLYLLDSNGIPNRYEGTAYVYSSAIWEGSEIQRWYIPVKDTTSGEAGLYDLKNNVFYPSSSSVPFTAGPELTIE